MGIAAILLLSLGLAVLGEVVEITPILTTPETPRYFHWALEAIARAGREISAMLSDCRRYYPGSKVNLLLDALTEARKRGVSVRVILEGREGLAPEVEAAFSFLSENGVDVRWDDPEINLHAKLLILDGAEVLLGSSPWTYNGLFGSVQVDLAVRSPTLAATFERFFELVWKGKFRLTEELDEARPPALIPVPELPQGRLLHLEVASQLIGEAQVGVELALYMLRRYPWDSPVNELTDALVAAAHRGVKVRVLLEGGEGWMESEFIQGAREVATYLLLHGVEVRLDPPGPTLHAKFLVVDGEDVLVSSANWAYYSLVKNVEAGLAFLKVPDLAESLTRFFEHLWARARPLP